MPCGGRQRQPRRSQGTCRAAPVGNHSSLSCLAGSENYAAPLSLTENGNLYLQKSKKQLPSGHGCPNDGPVEAGVCAPQREPPVSAFGVGGGGTPFLLFSVFWKRGGRRRAPRAEEAVRPVALGWTDGCRSWPFRTAPARPRHGKSTLSLWHPCVRRTTHRERTTARAVF